LVESNGVGHTASATKCNTVGQSGGANNAAGSGNNDAALAGPQAGCPTGTPWTTNAVPLNGATVSINWLGKAPLSKTSTNEEQVNPNTDTTVCCNTPIGSVVNVFTLNATDQFGNLTTTGGGNISVVSSGGGQLGDCHGYQDTHQ